MAEVRIAIVGFGKIARDQHVPAIAANADFRLVAAVSRHPVAAPGIRVFSDYRAMLEAGDLDAVAICTPPGPRYSIARECLDAGMHLLLEKPPTSTVCEITDLADLAASRSLTLFTTWHARFNEAVDAAAALIQREGLARLEIRWLEDVRKWHPDQDWIWRPGGFGVFDAGINALSIATYICPSALLMREAELHYAEAAATPIAARLRFESPGVSGPLEALFDWRHEGPENWTVDFTTRAGTVCTLADGGGTLFVDGSAMASARDEYPAIYRRFAALIGDGRSLVDSRPLSLVADAFLIGRRMAA